MSTAQPYPLALSHLWEGAALEDIPRLAAENSVSRAVSQGQATENGGAMHP